MAPSATHSSFVISGVFYNDCYGWFAVGGAGRIGGRRAVFTDQLRSVARQHASDDWGGSAAARATTVSLQCRGDSGRLSLLCRVTACRSTSGVGQVLRPIGSIIGGREEYRTFCIVCIRLALRNCGTDGTRSSGRIGLQSSPQKYLEQVAQGRRSNRGESLGVSKATFLHK